MIQMMSLHWVEALGWIASAMTVATYAMNTMVLLRILAILSSVFFILYAVMLQLWPLLGMELLLFPINSYRLWQILSLRGRLRDAAAREVDDFSVIRTYGQARSFPAGALVFAKGDQVENLYYIAKGRVRIEELGIEVAAEDIFGEIAFFSDAQTRMATVRCLDDTQVYQIDRKRFMRLQFEDPAFGMSIMRTVTRRLTENAALQTA